MKVVIWAGGLGTRISEESHLKPKPMIEIGGKPILWHIMKIYSHYGYNDFIICAGYKKEVIKEFFNNYMVYNHDVTFDFKEKKTIIHDDKIDDWKVTIVDTGLSTGTAGRLKKVQKYIGNEPFLVTYGDAVADVNIPELVKYHESHGKYATVTTVTLAQTKGVLNVDDNGNILAFREKEQEDAALINGGFMMMQPEIFDYINDDELMDFELLKNLSKEGQVKAYLHEGFWQCMDTQREKQKLENMCSKGDMPWKLWE
ncbi:MAG: glucose-1-phosphate cytidylyltransferase [Lachnospiraceae bacterium]|nr:glucose-1-phosphate cytidylyltransferase [Lachnospiraceae bacterium]